MNEAHQIWMKHIKPDRSSNMDEPKPVWAIAPSISETAGTGPAAHDSAGHHGQMKRWRWRLHWADKSTRWSSHASISKAARTGPAVCTSAGHPGQGEEMGMEIKSTRCPSRTGLLQCRSRSVIRGRVGLIWARRSSGDKGTRPKEPELAEGWDPLHDTARCLHNIALLTKTLTVTILFLKRQIFLCFWNSNLFTNHASTCTVQMNDAAGKEQSLFRTLQYDKKKVVSSWSESPVRIEKPDYWSPDQGKR